MILQSRPVTADDIKTICSFVLDARELFYMFPKAQYPLTEAQLADECVAVERAAHRSVSRLLPAFSNQPQHATMRPTPALGSASVDTGEAERKPSKERP